MFSTLQNLKVFSFVKGTIPTADVDFGLGTTGAIEDNAQAGKISCTNPSITAGSVGTLEVTNSYVKADSVVLITLEPTHRYDAAPSVMLGQVAEGTFTVHICPTLTTFTGTFYIHYLII